MQDKPNRDNVYAVPNGLIYTYYLSDCVQDSHEYHELLQLLDCATEQDVVKLVINNCGGEAGTCVQIVDHIRNCKGLVVGVLSGNAFSAASVIYLACHRQELGQHSMVMIHNAVGYVEGKYGDMEEYTRTINKRTKQMYSDVFREFLTPEEIDKVMDGKEFWLTHEQIAERLEHREKVLTKECQDQQEQMYADMMEDDLPDAILNKLTKKQLIDYINGKINVNVLEDGKFEIVEIDENNLENS